VSARPRPCSNPMRPQWRGMFLDDELRLRRFNQTVLRLLGLREEDRGRALDDLRLRADFPDLHERVREVLRSGEPTNQRVRGPEGTMWNVHVRLTDAGHHEGGVIVTFHDLLAWQERQQQARASEMASELLGLEAEVPMDYVLSRDPAVRADSLPEGHVRSYTRPDGEEVTLRLFSMPRQPDAAEEARHVVAASRES